MTERVMDLVDGFTIHQDLKEQTGRFCYYWTRSPDDVGRQPLSMADGDALWRTVAEVRTPRPVSTTINTENEAK